MRRVRSKKWDMEECSRLRRVGEQVPMSSTNGRLRESQSPSEGCGDE